MIEKIFKLTQGNEKTVEKVIIDENIHYMHMILNKGECLPEHFSNAKNVYITVVRGTLSAFYIISWPFYIKKGVFICIKMVHLCHLKKLGDAYHRITFFLGCTSIQDTRLRVVNIKKRFLSKKGV